MDALKTLRLLAHTWHPSDFGQRANVVDVSRNFHDSNMIDHIPYTYIGINFDCGDLSGASNYESVWIAIASCKWNIPAVTKQSHDKWSSNNKNNIVIIWNVFLRIEFFSFEPCSSSYSHIWLFFPFADLRFSLW